MLLACLVTGCGRSEVAKVEVLLPQPEGEMVENRPENITKVEALLPPPLPLSPEVAEIFKLADQIYNASEEPSYRVFKSNHRDMLFQAKARYGDTKDSAEVFDKLFKELDAEPFDSSEKEGVFGMILVRMDQAGLTLDAVRKAEASSSPIVQAVAPYIIGRLQTEAEQYEGARKSFKQALELLRGTSELRLAGNIVFGIIHFASQDDSMLDVIVVAEACVPEEGFQHSPIPRFMFAQAWYKQYKDDLAAGRFEPFLKRAEAEKDDRAKAEYVRAVIKEQMKQGEFAEVPKTIDRFFPPGAPKKEVAADAAAIFGRFDGRDLCLETWAIGCTQHGKLTEAMTVADSIEELKRRNAAINKMIGVLIGKDVKATVLYGLLPDTILGGDAPDDEIPPPEYSEAELLEFCRWYAETAEQWPSSPQNIQRTAAAAGLMDRFGFKKEANELFEKAFANLLALERKEYLNYEAEPIIKHRIGTGDFDAVFALFEKLSENGIRIDKIRWFLEMGKFDDAIALAEENKSSWKQIGSAFIAADRKEEAQKAFERAMKLELATEYPDPALVASLLQAEMIDQAFRYIEHLPNAERKAEALTWIARKQWMDGDTTSAEKTLLEAVRQVEKMDPQAEGNRHIRLQGILMVLGIDLKLVQRLSEKRG